MKPLRQLVAENIKRFREVSGMTQGELGQKIGIPASTAAVFIYQYEQGKRSPSKERLEKIADALGMAAQDFFTDWGQASGVPLLGEVESSGKVRPVVTATQEMIPLPPGYNPEKAYREGLYALRVKELLAQPFFRPGWTLFVRLIPAERMKSGDIIVHREPGHPGAVSEVKRATNGKFIAVCDGCEVCFEVIEDLVEKVFAITL